MQRLFWAPLVGPTTQTVFPCCSGTAEAWCIVCSALFLTSCPQGGRDVAVELVSSYIWGEVLSALKWCCALWLSKMDPSSALNKPFTLLLHPPPILFIVFSTPSYLFFFLTFSYPQALFPSLPASHSVSASRWQYWAPQAQDFSLIPPGLCFFLCPFCFSPFLIFSFCYFLPPPLLGMACQVGLAGSVCRTLEKTRGK